ncbi:hypothetical protein [Streptomyces sp. NPDC001389]|uniref:hypothetical protein n=1 Tax=Streptomyces sp. NPDC001389 TaxID=3364569 RepID=UPI0036B3324C
MVALTKSQQATVDNARRALDASHEQPVGTDDRALAYRLGRLEVALEQALCLVDELTGGA